MRENDKGEPYDEPRLLLGIDGLDMHIEYAIIERLQLFIEHYKSDIERELRGQ